MVYKVFDKKSASICVNVHANNESPLDLATQKLAEELHKTLKFFLKKQFFQDFKKMSWMLI